MTKHINRRGFLKTSTLGVLGAGAISGVSVSLTAQEEKSKPVFPKIRAYRTLGRTGFKASDIGIGTSRQFTVPVLKALLEAGVNYIDTAEGYGRGASEKNVGEAIKGTDRKSIFITSKLGIKPDVTKEEVLERFGKCLERLDTPYIDCLMIHGANPETIKADGFHQATEQLKNEGKLKYIGASNHGSHRSKGKDDTMEKALVAAVEDGRFDVLLIVYNFLQRDQAEKILAAAKAKNVGTTIMKSNPIGRYYGMQERMAQMKKEGKEIGERMLKYMDRMKETAAKAEVFIKKNNLQNPTEVRDAALRFVLNNPDAHVLTLAFSSFEDIEGMLPLSGTHLKGKDKKTLAAYKEGCGNFYCRHACGLCESSCPRGVPVNTIMRYNHYFDAHGSEKYAMEKYARLELTKADACAACTGGCESACPYNVPIQSLLVMAHQQLTLA